MKERRWEDIEERIIKMKDSLKSLQERKVINRTPLRVEEEEEDKKKDKYRRIIEENNERCEEDGRMWRLIRKKDSRCKEGTEL